MVFSEEQNVFELHWKSMIIWDFSRIAFLSHKLQTPSHAHPHLPHFDWWPQLNSPPTHTSPTPSSSSSSSLGPWNHWRHPYEPFTCLDIGLTWQDRIKWGVCRQEPSAPHLWSGPPSTALVWFGDRRPGKQGGAGRRPETETRFGAEWPPSSPILTLTWESRFINWSTPLCFIPTKNWVCCFKPLMRP